MPPFASYPSLKDRPVFVSGGGSGIGASIVEHFVEQGAMGNPPQDVYLLRKPPEQIS